MKFRTIVQVFLLMFSLLLPSNQQDESIIEDILGIQPGTDESKLDPNETTLNENYTANLLQDNEDLNDKQRQPTDTLFTQSNLELTEPKVVSTTTSTTTTTTRTTTTTTTTSTTTTAGTSTIGLENILRYDYNRLKDEIQTTKTEIYRLRSGLNENEKKFENFTKKMDDSPFSKMIDYLKSNRLLN